MCVKCIHRYWALTHLFPGVWNSVQSFGRRHLHVGDSLGSSDQILQDLRQEICVQTSSPIFHLNQYPALAVCNSEISLLG